MKKLFSTIIWDLILYYRSGIILVAFIISAIYASIFLFLPKENMLPVVVLLIFSDPTFLGFIFIGVIILYEKSFRTLEALVVTPIKTWQYLWSKSISLALVVLPLTILIAIAGHGFKMNYVLLISDVFLSSMIFTFAGIVGVSKVTTFNQYILTVPIMAIPAILPIIDYLKIWESPLFFLIPTQSTLDLLNMGFTKTSNISIVYHLAYLTGWVYLAYVLAKKHFIKNVVVKQKL